MLYLIKDNYTIYSELFKEKYGVIHFPTMKPLDRVGE
jgi:hypothetical protein